MSRLTVVYGKLFLEEAELKFPPERSMAYSGPTFGEFMDRPVRAARLKFSRDWHSLPEDFGGLARSVILPPAGPFVPIVFYGLLITRGAGTAVEIAGFEADDDYWEKFDDDTLA